MNPESRHNAMFVHSRDGIPPTLGRVLECAQNIHLDQIAGVLGKNNTKLKPLNIPDYPEIEIGKELIANEYGEPAILIHVETEVHPEKYD